MTPNEQFEIMAAVFQSMTGYTAPGKSTAPAAYAGEKYETERRQEWDEWVGLYGIAVMKTIRACNGNRP